jgi:hypothetical protein
MNIALIKNVIKYLVENDRLPSIEFRDETVIGALLKNIASTTIVNPGETPSQSADRWVDELFANMDENLAAELAEIANVTATGLLNAVNEIKTIQSVVEGLCQKIDKIVDRGVSLDPELAKILDKGSVEVNYQSINYAPLDVMGNSKSVSYGMFEFMGIAGTAQRQGYISVIERYVQMKKAGTIEDFAVSETDTKAIIDSVVASTPSATVESVTDALSILTTKVRLDTLMINCSRNTQPAANQTENMFEALRIVDRYATVLIKLQDELIRRDYKKASELSNFKSFYAVLEVYHFFVNYHRENTFNGTILFTNQYLNTDVINQAKEAMITNEDIARHISVVYNNKLVVGTGLALSAVIADKANVLLKFKNATSKNELYAKLQLAQMHKSATMKVMGEYLESLGIRDSKYIDAKTDQLILTGISVEDLLYGIIITKNYMGTIVDVLHNKLGTALRDVVIQNPDVSGDIVHVKMLSVYVDVVTTVIAKKILQ